MTIRHVFFDVGGVLGTDGWDHRQRAAAAERFGLDLAEFQDRHEEAVSSWEAGGMSMDEYLDLTVFHRLREFTRDDFKAFIFAQSEPFPDVIALARALSGRYRLYTLNNESAELNAYRIDKFGLRDIFVAYFSSCWLRAVKPAPRIYELALAMSQAAPDTTVFIDDRERNLDVPRELGMHVIRFENARALRETLGDLGVSADGP
jgi:putative hydrolase of the HAD superfamily